IVSQCRQQIQDLLILDQQAERFKRPDWNEFEPEEAVRGKRQLVDYRFSLIERLGIHQEDHARLILAEPELLDLAFKIKFECVRNFLPHHLSPLFVRDRLGECSDSENLHDYSPCQM